MSGNKNVLLTWNSNWADEMDIQGFIVTTQSEYDDWKTFLENKKLDFEIYVGTNEGIEYSSGAELLAEVDVEDITSEEMNVVLKMFGTEFGFTEFWNQTPEKDEDEENEDEY